MREKAGTAVDEIAQSDNPRPERRIGPKGILGLLCAISLLVFADRGIISSNGVIGSRATDVTPAHGIQGDYNLSTAQLGLISSVFMVGLLASSPGFALASKHCPGFKLIAFGLGIWVLAVAGTGISFSYWSLMACRALVGVGEACFVALAAPFIDDNAPAGSKARWLAIFYVCIPVGYAAGYLVGGLLAGPLTWRGPFMVESGAMLPMLILCALLPDRLSSAPKPGTEAAAGTVKAQALEGKAGGTWRPEGRLWELVGDLGSLLSHPVFVLTMLGATAYIGTLSSISFLGPKAGAETFHVPGTTADSMFAAVTSGTGIVGCLMGGWVLDALGCSIAQALGLCAVCSAVGMGGWVLKALGCSTAQALGLCAVCSAIGLQHSSSAGAVRWAAGYARSIAPALGLCAVCSAIACVCLMSAFGLASSLPVFGVLFAAGKLALQACQAPYNAVAMWSVPPQLRSLALSTQLVAMHMLGDVPVVPVLGWIQDRVHNWRITMAACTSLLLIAVALFASGALLSRRQPDYSRKDAQEAVESVALTTLGPGTDAVSGQQV